MLTEQKNFRNNIETCGKEDKKYQFGVHTRQIGLKNTSRVY